MSWHDWIKKEIQNVKVGDFIWLGRGDNLKKRLEEVVKITATQIVTPHDRYYRTNGSCIGYSTVFGVLHAQSIATPAEVKAWKRSVAAERAAETRRENKQKAEAIKREALQSFMPKRASVHNGDNDTFEVVIRDLSPTMVERLAAVLEQHMGFKPGR
jgi:hypothetical protein